jgi:hypothetical protein
MAGGFLLGDKMKLRIYKSPDAILRNTYKLFLNRKHCGQYMWYGKRLPNGRVKHARTVLEADCFCVSGAMTAMSDGSTSEPRCEASNRLRKVTYKRFKISPIGVNDGLGYEAIMDCLAEAANIPLEKQTHRKAK